MAFKDKWLLLGATTLATQESKEAEEMCVPCVWYSGRFGNSAGACATVSPHWEECDHRQEAAELTSNWAPTLSSSWLHQVKQAETCCFFFLYQLKQIKTRLQHSLSLVAGWGGIKRLRLSVSSPPSLLWQTALSTLSWDIHDILKCVSSCLRKGIWGIFKWFPEEFQFCFFSDTKLSWIFWI